MLKKLVLTVDRQLMNCQSCELWSSVQANLNGRFGNEKVCQLCSSSPHSQCKRTFTWKCALKQQLDTEPEIEIKNVQN